ncbi:MAG: hypothetical protein HY718_16720 [Planctomycetes bacterium]|nr:hypothetical protein [Planctomycetota bacterium]
MKNSRKRTPVRVGDSRFLHVGTRRIRVRVIEDRGPIGVGGRRLVRVQRLNSETEEPLAFEVPAEDLSSS